MSYTTGAERPRRWTTRNVIFPRYVLQATNLPRSNNSAPSVQLSVRTSGSPVLSLRLPPSPLPRTSLNLLERRNAFLHTSRLPPVHALRSGGGPPSSFCFYCSPAPRALFSRSALHLRATPFLAIYFALSLSLLTVRTNGGRSHSSSIDGSVYSWRNQGG